MSKGAVIATKAEIDPWVTASPIRSTYRLAQSAQDQGARLEEFRVHVQELHRLRAEAGRLHEGLKQAFSLLQASFCALREQQVVVSSSKHQKSADIQTLDPTKKPTDLVH